MSQPLDVEVSPVTDTMSIASRRGSTTSLIPPSPSTIKRPSSAQSYHRSAPPSAIEPEAESKNVKVVVRIRPPDPDDPAAPPRFRNTLVHPTSASELRVDVDPAMLAGQAVGVSQANGVKKHPTFGFDHVLSEASSQTDVYGATGAEVIEEFVKGHNITFLAYGQTSSGKSYTMGTTGDEGDYSGTDFTARTGLIPRTVHAILERAEDLRLASGPSATWECRLSFLELYNEEIIDLLSGSGVQISIREEKDGRIVWSGVREVKVKTLADVMALLQEGSARRKTGATGMNASSSRSHAIFSLTLVQRRRAGPITANGDAASKIKRPNSMLGFSGRSGTPSGARSTTPSGSRGPPTAFSTQQQFKKGHGRPNSMQIAPLTKEDDVVIVTSKFNMVDLAGSERLKRTAAQGERMKEGISINSGLLALGNVISTLADPMKARGHVPYRDSKLTRMLQDSIGGNALTTMIACVSPIEFNIGETLNTIKYASRARNIRNAAKVNQVEAGWDDVEHLQNTVHKLRKQIAETGTELKVNTGSPMSEEKQKQSQKLLGRLAELQREHTDLYDRYLAKCSDNMRLTSELRQAQPGEGDAMAKFNETVEPVILEYEKVVSALNTQLEDLREEITATVEMYESQGQQLREAIERQASSDAYVLELRGRLQKLSERDAASEGYIRDLEAKLKTVGEKEGRHAEIVSALRKEISTQQEANTRLTQHTAELESRLVSSETRSSQLVSQIEKHEKEIERRDQAYKDLEAHIALLDTTEDNKALLEELQERDSRIIEMTKDHEEKQEQLARELAEASAARENPASSASSTLSAFPSSEIASTSRSMLNGSSSGSIMPISTDGLPAGSSDEVDQLRAALRALTAKYQDSEARYSQAENKIADLSQLLSEARLVHAEIDDVLPPSPNAPSCSLDEASDESTTTTLQTPAEELETLDTSPSKASRKWHRGSMPTISTVSLKGRDFRVGRGVGADSRRGRPQSLSQELSSAQPHLSSRSSWTGPSTLLLAPSPSRQSMPVIHPVRSMQSLEAELKFVHQKVNERDDELREREAYIKQLETTIQDKQLHLSPSHKSSAQSLLLPQMIPLPPSPTTPTPKLKVIDTSPAQLDSLEEIADVEEEDIEQKQRLSALKHSLSKLEEGVVSDSQVRVDDLMRVMASKEASLRQTIQQQVAEIDSLQKSNKRLKEELFAAEPASPSKAKMQTARVTPKPTPAVGDDGIELLREAHSAELEQLIASHSQTVARLQADHEAAMDLIRQSATKQSSPSDTDAMTESLAVKEREHAEVLAKLEKDHEAFITEMETSLSASEEQRRQLKMRADQAMFELSRIRDEGQLQHNQDVKQISDLQRVNSNLEKVKAELETSNNELSKKVSEMELRFSRRPSPLPPQGPPPTSPLPPIPRSPSMPYALPMSKFASGSSMYTASGSSQGHGNANANGNTLVPGQQRLSNGSMTDIQSIIANLPDGPQQNVQKVVSERDTAVQQKDLFRQQLAVGQDKLKEAESKWIEERQKAETLGRDLAEARKTSSKLRAHLEDSRADHRKQVDQCKEHTAELDARRQQMTKLSEETQQGRASLQAANAQVATLKAQLDRAVEQKVQKRLLKCF